MWFTKPSRRSMPVRLVWSCTTTATSPSLPMSSAILSAASAGRGQVVGGGGRHRDVAVDARVERDRPGSSPPAPSSAAGSPPCCPAPRSRCAFGFLASAAESMSICLSTIASVSGPSKVTLTLKSLRGLLGARLHGLPELVLEALRDERDVGLLRREHRPRARRERGGQADAPAQAFLSCMIMSMSPRRAEFRSGYGESASEGPPSARRRMST